ncbi:hypothetical protein [Nonomuraea turcica]|uniref:hypothetical protein n=1 Tax=Nonomuraea sp. G32 TaxID=3067274 RepID=UPI00273C1D0E|nr:hypothetical protein [Nonomuraea sp. G32]MDP4512111.1 hypothetical protein [Nonomuraea sp. G32]
MQQSLCHGGGGDGLLALLVSGAQRAGGVGELGTKPIGLTWDWSLKLQWHLVNAFQCPGQGTIPPRPKIIEADHLGACSFPRGLSTAILMTFRSEIV